MTLAREMTQEKLASRSAHLAHVHRAARVHRAAPALLAARAWLERDKCAPETAPAGRGAGSRGADETKLLLGDLSADPRGLTLHVFDLKRPAPSARSETKDPMKTNFQKKKERLYEILRPPYFIVSLIVIFVCLEMWAGEEWRSALEYAPGAVWARGEAWRLVTYCALHAGAQHLALNALVSLAVGWVLEREQGARRLAALWSGGAVAGALGASVFQPTVRVVGASAGVYTLLTSHLANVALGYGQIKMWWFRVLAVCVLGASDCAWLLVRGAGAGAGEAHAQLAAPPPPPPVAWSAHAAGAAVGLPLALLIFTGRNASQRWMVGARVASGALLLAALAAALLSNLYLHPDAVR